MSTIPAAYIEVRHPFGLPMGTVRGFMSLLICAFFWIFLLLPAPPDQRPMTAPLSHFFLLTLVFLAFASHPFPVERARAEFLPWLMRVLFVGGSVAVVAYVAVQYPERLALRLTPEASEVVLWPVLLGTLSGGFGFGLFLRAILGRNSNMFQTLRAWIGVIAILLLVVETVFQFAVRPSLGEPPSAEATKIWDGIIMAFVAAYFGTRS